MGKTAGRIWPIGIILFAWLIFAAPYFFKGLVPFPSRYLVTFFPPWNASYGMPVKNNAMPDVITQIYPWKKLTIDTWKKGEIPLWNPYSFSGTPHLANYQSAVLSPFNLLFFVLPEIDAWSLMILLQPFLAGLFMYIFLRSLDRSQAGSVIGSLAFMFCGFLVVWMAYGTLGYAALFLPFILWAIRKKKRVLVSVGLALSFFSGHFQISVYVAVASFFYALFFDRKSIIFLLFGLMLASAQILPGLEAYKNSVRSSLFTPGEIIPLQYLITIVAPDFFGNPVTRNDWFGHYAEWASFVGVIPLVLAINALIQKKTRIETFFFVVGFVALILATTPLLFQLKIPALSTSAASRIIVLTSFSLSVLSSFGADKKKKMQFIIPIFVIGMWAILQFLKPFDAEKLLVAKRNFILPSIILIATVTSLRWKKFSLVVLVVLTVFDMLRFASKWMPFEERQYVYPEMPVIAFLKERVGNDRVFGNFGNELATYFGIPSLEGYDAVYQKRYGEFISTFHDGSIGQLSRSVVAVDKQGKYTEDMFQLLGVRYILHRISDDRNIWAYPFWNYPHYKQIYKDEWFEVYENTKVFPRAFLMSSSFVPEGEAIIELYRPTRVKIRTLSDAQKLLFLSDTYDPGWKVTIDGKPGTIQLENYAFRVVSVPQGEHSVEFTYKPKSFTFGIWLAALSIVFIIYAHRFL